MKIIRTFDRATLFEDYSCNTLRDAVLKAIANRANLIGANLSGADLSGADLRSANLSGADLSGADLSGADLSGAKLIGADLIGADLIGADLSGANLIGANLSGADLPSPTVVLLASWGTVSDQLCADLMLFDSQCHPDPVAFDMWVSTGTCPYSGVKVQRAANFAEKKELWGQGQASSIYDLMARVLAEKCEGFSKETK
jgi:hypothetical protein